MNTFHSEKIRIQPINSFDVKSIITSRSVYESIHKTTISDYALPLYEEKIENWLTINQENSLFFVSFFDSTNNLLGIGGAFELNRPGGVVELYIDAPLEKQEITFFILNELTKIMKKNYWFKTMIIWLPLYKKFDSNILNEIKWSVCVTYPKKIRWNSIWIDHCCLTFSETHPFSGQNDL